MGSADAQNAVFNEYAKSCIRVMARRLSQQKGFTRFDEEDLQQDLWLVLLREAKRFDPERASLHTFIDRVVRAAGGMIARRRHRQKRAAGGRIVSLEQQELSEDGETGSSLSHRISEADLARRIGVVRRTAASEQEFANALDSMPQKIRDVCLLVMDGTITSAARELGWPRSQACKALALARRYFVRAGISNPW